MIDKTAAVIKTTVINYAQRILSFLALGTTPLSTTSTASVVPGRVGLVPAAAYLKNVCYYVPTADGMYKKYKIVNVLCRNGISTAHKDKGEGELAIEFTSHHTKDTPGDVWDISDVASIT